MKSRTCMCTCTRRMSIYVRSDINRDICRNSKGTPNRGCPNKHSGAFYAQSRRMIEPDDALLVDAGALERVVTQQRGAVQVDVVHQ